jgi:hypothetical protein
VGDGAPAADAMTLCWESLRMQFGENALWQHGRGRILGTSRLRPQSPSEAQRPMVPLEVTGFEVRDSTRFMPFAVCYLLEAIP